jgi:predicted nucleic acid-binding protein
MDPTIVSDASPILAYHAIDRLHPLHRLFGAITIPTAVAGEVALCERESLELGAHWSITDDLRARRTGRQVGLSVVGSVGIAIRAKQRGYLETARPTLDTLIATGLFVSPALHHDALASVGEVG